MQETSANNKRIAKNTLALYFRMIIQMIVGLYTSRVILLALGVDDYGIYNVVGSMTAMLSFISGSMANATSRFITFEIGRNNQERLKLVFCTAVNIHILLAVITFLFLDSFGLWFLYNKMVIDPLRINAAFWVLQFSIITVVIDIISVPYNSAIIAHEKMGTFAFISLYQTCITLLMILYIPYFSGDKLVLYAIILMIVQLSMRFIYGAYCNRYFEETKYNFVWEKPLVKEMAKFAGWTMNGNIAWLAYTQGINMLINLFFGTTVNAARGVAFNVQSKIMGFCNNFQTAVRPQIVKLYSVGEFERMHRLILSSSRFSYYLMLFLSLPIYLEIDMILRLWLGVVPEHTGNFVRIILLSSVVDIFRNPMNAAIHATGDIKKYQLWEANTLLLIVPLAYVLLKLGYGPEWAFLVQLIIFVIVQIERIWIVCPKIHMKKRLYWQKLMCPTIFVTICSVLPCVFIMSFYPLNPNKWNHILIYVPLSLLTSFISIYYIGLQSYEKEKIKSYIKTKFHIS